MKKARSLTPEFELYKSRRQTLLTERAKLLQAKRLQTIPPKFLIIYQRFGLLLVGNHYTILLPQLRLVEHLVTIVLRKILNDKIFRY